MRGTPDKQKKTGRKSETYAKITQKIDTKINLFDSFNVSREVQYTLLLLSMKT